MFIAFSISLNEKLFISKKEKPLGCIFEDKECGQRKAENIF